MLKGHEKGIELSGETSDFTVLEFWQWAYGDLMANNVRGVFAEWLVARLLGLSPPVRDSWSAWDLEIDGLRLEVKCGAYIQSWHKTGEALSRIAFGGLKARTYIQETRTYTEEEAFNSDLYVFCVNECRDRAIWNALDLRQWRFYVLERADLERVGCKTLSLDRLKSLGAMPLDAETLPHRVAQLIDAHAANHN